MNEKDLEKLLEKTNLVSALVFINPETHAVIIHLDGFEDLEHGRKFTDNMFKKSGIILRKAVSLFFNLISICG